MNIFWLVVIVFDAIIFAIVLAAAAERIKSWLNR